MKQEWIRLCQRVDYQFKKPEILRQALTHKSYLPVDLDEKFSNNERIEFLGDAVLDLVISEMLMEGFRNSMREDSQNSGQAWSVNPDSANRP